MTRISRRVSLTAAMFCTVALAGCASTSSSPPPASPPPSASNSVPVSPGTELLSANQESMVAEMMATANMASASPQLKTVIDRVSASVPGSAYAFTTLLAAQYMASRNVNGWTETETKTKTKTGNKSVSLNVPAKKGTTVLMALNDQTWQASFTGGGVPPVCVTLPSAMGASFSVVSGPCSAAARKAATGPLMAIAAAAMGTNPSPS